MVYNRFFLKSLVRVILILASVIVLALIFGRNDLLFTQLLIGVIIISQVYELTYWVNSTNKELSRFLNAIKSGDYAVNFTHHNQTRSFQKLNQAFKEITELLKLQETKNAAQFQFLYQLVNQIDFGIICFDADNEIELINKKACELIQVPNVKKWAKLNNPNISILSQFTSLPASGDALFEANIEGRKRILTIKSTPIKSLEKEYRIIAFNDIKNEIQTKEIEAWHKLIRILTHEIMNSVTPILSLNETIELILTENQKPKTTLEQEEIEDLYEASQTIKTRNESMLSFVNDFRKLTRISVPEKSKVKIAELFEQIHRLYKADFSKYEVDFYATAGEQVINVDPTLIEQVLINLVKNSLDAFSESGGKSQKNINMIFSENEDSWQIDVMDNGPGITEDIIGKVTVPFFTTKKEGSGIGLSFCRQILNLHSGYIDINSVPYEETTISLIIPKS